MFSKVSVVFALVALWWKWSASSTARLPLIVTDAANADARSQEGCIKTGAKNLVLLLYQMRDIYWKSCYGSTDYFELTARETFDGQNYNVDLTDVGGIEEVFTVSGKLQASDEIPLIRNVHTLD